MSGECLIAEVSPCATVGSGWDDEQILALIDAAPSLLDALRGIVDWLIPDLVEDQKSFGPDGRLKQIESYLNKARAAIASATGKK